jgi:hypothetical protein
MTAQEMIFTIRLDDGSLAEATTWDSESARTFQKLIEDPAYGRDLRIRAAEPSDTSGHAMAADTITVSVRQEDDLEGHTMTLRFPSAEEAKRFQKRLIITGALAASLVVGAAGVQLASQQGTNVVPQAGPAVVAPAAVPAPAPLDSMKPGNIDARLRDSTFTAPSVAVPDAQSPGDIDAGLRDSAVTSGGSSQAIVSPAKDTKDDLASGIGGSDTSPSQPGNRGVMPR